MNWTPSLIVRAVISVIMLIGYFYIMFLFMSGQVKYTEGVREPTIMLLSTLGISIGAMLQYWFGTSQSGAERAAAEIQKLPVMTQFGGQSTTQSTATPPIKPE